MQGWYREVVDHALPPARVTFERITAECKELYSALPPPGETIPTSVPPYPIDKSLPTYEEVKWAVRRLRGHRLGGPSHMRTEHLWEWLRDHRATEVATEAATEAEGETSGPEDRESATKEGTSDGEEERESNK